MSEKRKILVVDDEDALRSVLSGELVSEGYDVHTAADGDDAISNVQKERFDLVLLDIKMPRVNGFQVLRWMRLVGLDQPPVLVLSGSDLDVDKSLALALGAREYHVKSADIHTFTKLLVDLSQRWLQPQS